MSRVPVSTHAVESAVVNAPADVVWGHVSSLQFNWWRLVQSCTLADGPSNNTVGALFNLNFRDGVQWTIQLVEFSSLNKTLTFEVISSEPSMPVTSVIHTISLRRITANNATYVEWVTDFSNDATVEIVSDSSFKRLDAFKDLQNAC